MENDHLDLWPAFLEGVDAVTPPLGILRKQASLLETKTREMVKAEVEVGRVLNFADEFSGPRARSQSGQAPENMMSHHFWLIAPGLGNYRYQLFAVIQPVEMYPLQIVDSPVGDIKVATEEEFLRELRKIFAAEKTQRIISALVAQIRAA